ncbi:oligosaccharide flippase family protein [Enterococcus faecium]|uniref:oligosaccharide flippase family protein n=1 Tax=Enterococcus TaxID=1350 RepID=UPI00209135A0|nr:oligosaccharide flippase family protein [Enterococcus faecium]MCO5468966.1 oligosaccharide flippase family protein [Enterococcus faecium]MDK4435101.1 oligosaccharide flippase family protein [Enterococcus faecium]MDW7897284.1 oligosaccharide flippase family protein [Enterococcus faecium]
MKIVKNYIFNLSYQLFTILIPIVTVPYISRTLGADAIGTNAYTNSIMSYFILLANVGLSLYGNRTIAYSRDDEKQRSQKFFEIAFLKLLLMLFSLFLFFIFCFFYKKYQVLLLFQSIQLIAVGFDISWFFVGIEDFKKTVTRNIFVKTISLICIFIFVKKPEDLVLYVFINGVASLLGNLTLWTYIRRYVKKVPFKDLKFSIHLKPIFSLFIPQLATTIFMTLNRLFLGNLSTLEQTGYFDNADKIVRIFLAFITALGTVVFPRIANFYKQKMYKEVEKYVEYSFNMVSLIAFPITFGILSVASPFSNLFFGNKFSGIDTVLSVLIFELIFMSWSSIIGQQFLVAVDKVRGLTISMIISIAISAVGSITLIPHYGAIGAASMSVVAELTIIVVQLIYVRNLLNLNYIFKDVWKYLFSSLLMYIICFVTKQLLSSWSDLSLLIGISFLGVITYLISLTFLRPKFILNIWEDLKFKRDLK